MAYEEVLADGNEGEFHKYKTFYHAVSMCVYQVGEYVTKMNREWRANDDFNWKEIVGMRNFFAHDYPNMDANEIWHSAHLAIGELKDHVELTMRRLEHEQQ